MARPRLRGMPVLRRRAGELCEQQYNNGYGVDGAYAEYMLADARFAVPVPDSVTPLERGHR